MMEMMVLLLIIVIGDDDDLGVTLVYEDAKRKEKIVAELGDFKKRRKSAAFGCFFDSVRCAQIKLSSVRGCETLQCCLTLFPFGSQNMFRLGVSVALLLVHFAHIEATFARTCPW